MERLALKAAADKKKSVGTKTLGLDFDCPRKMLVDEILRIDAERAATSPPYARASRDFSVAMAVSRFFSNSSFLPQLHSQDTPPV